MKVSYIMTISAWSTSGFQYKLPFVVDHLHMISLAISNDC